ncbi:hypothetical protein PFISCL1PPCAC_17248, partial [Pristionchus fissidentatus]
AGIIMAGQRILVYGGKGALGSSLVDSFKTRGYWVLSVGENEKADAFISVPKDCSTVLEQEQYLLKKVSEKLGEGNQLHAILCVAGGWAGGNAANEAMVKNADLMFRQSLWSSLIASRLAALHLAPNGLLQFTGAAGALSGSPGMIGYGMAKAAVHQLTASLAAEKSGLASGVTVLALLPTTLDTPMNRKWMPKADHSSWTPLSWIADLLHSYLADPTTRPVSGSLLKLETVAGESTIVPSKM